MFGPRPQPPDFDPVLGVRVLAGICRPTCAGRLAAIIDGTFLPDVGRGGWIARDGPWMYRDANFPLFVTCPWCGYDLPAPVDED